MGAFSVWVNRNQPPRPTAYGLMTLAYVQPTPWWVYVVAAVLLGLLALFISLTVAEVRARVH